MGLTLERVQDQPRAVTHSVNEFIVVLLEAVAVVLVVSFVSLGLRTGPLGIDMRPGLVVAITIPLVMAITFIVMHFWGVGLHKISLGSLIIALGLLVDDAIIAVEMMVRKLEEGYDRMRAATYAYEVTAMPMLTGTLITAAGFLPIGIARSVTSEYTYTGTQQEILFSIPILQMGMHTSVTPLALATLPPSFPISFGPALGDKISIWSNSTNSYGLGIQSSLLQIHTDISAADIAFGYGSSTSLVETMRIKGNGNVGIGTSSPYSPLTFNDNLGQKISLYGTTGNNYGFGIQGGLLQIHSDAPGADIAFGYGSSSSFTETMRIKGNGNMGIGNSNLLYMLDISNRMRIRSGGNNSVSAGLWLNNNANTETAFIGMEDDTHVGFYGNTGAGWKFSMNTQTGALKVNGTEGAAGQILTSGGTGAPASIEEVIASAEYMLARQNDPASSFRLTFSKLL